MNNLHKETSPYLLQHANNPVHWQSWSKAAFDKAAAENKLVIVSIGYSTCHWCHVMEHETFEDAEAAYYMNRHFVCIKVDREERPDVDSQYMDAVHLMGQRGGWPLHVFTLPDGRPVYGGTYFRKIQWLSVMENLVNLQQTEPAKMEEYASSLHSGLKQLQLISSEDSTLKFEPNFLFEVLDKWSKNWDTENGGERRAPKFPMPGNLLFLLNFFALVRSNESNPLFRSAAFPEQTDAFDNLSTSCWNHVNLTLQKMARGGIFDQVGGGFARYSVDAVWKVPHFEKMLYDNAQLVSAYSMALGLSGHQIFREAIELTLNFIERELTTEDGLFYSALDADSEEVEGKFYVWQKEEISEVLGADINLAKDYFSINEEGYWENNEYILLRNTTDETFALSQSLTLDELEQFKLRAREKLIAHRNKRIRPGLDDKCITSWNALMIKGLVDAANALQNSRYLDVAVNAAQALFKLLKSPDGGLMHTRTKGQTSIRGFLDDYAFTIEALIALYQSTMTEKWLLDARDLTAYCIQHFFDKKNGLFLFTDNADGLLINVKAEIEDNVIPSSNSTMCRNLFLLSRYFANENWEQLSLQMLRTVKGNLHYASGYSGWLQSYCWRAFPFYELVITGENTETILKEANRKPLPNTLIAASTTDSSLPLFQNRIGTKTAIYVCHDKSCYAPVETLEKALALIFNN